MGPDYLFVMLVGQEYQVSGPEERVLKGDAEKYPGAFIEFAVTCLPVESDVSLAAVAGGNSSENQNLSEREREILRNDNERQRNNEYLEYLQVFKTIDDDEQKLRAEFEVQGQMYSETSLFRILRTLDQMISLVLEGSEGFEIVEKISDPENLKFLIELSVIAQPRNQVLIQKMIQNILKLNLPHQILDKAVLLA